MKVKETLYARPPGNCLINHDSPLDTVMMFPNGDMKKLRDCSKRELLQLADYFRAAPRNDQQLSDFLSLIATDGI